MTINERGIRWHQNFNASTNTHGCIRCRTWPCGWCWIFLQNIHLKLSLESRNLELLTWTLNFVPRRTFRGRAESRESNHQPEGWLRQLLQPWVLMSIKICRHHQIPRPILVLFLNKNLFSLFNCTNSGRPRTHFSSHICPDCAPLDIIYRT